MSHQENFRELIELLLSNRINPEQRIRLVQMMQEPEHNSELDELLKESFYTYPDTSAESMENALLFVAAIKTKMQTDRPAAGTRRTHRLFFFTRIAAAVFILALASGVYFLHFKKKDKPVLSRIHAPAPATDIQPGSNKAVLTLSDGSSIDLNDVKDGNLASQGNARIVKEKNGGLVYRGGSHDGLVLYNNVTTPAGGQYHLSLQDGTSVWLDALSSIHFPVAFTGNTREVSITGQVYFEVAKNPSKPFRVTVKNQAVEVLGTHFNINAYDNEGLIKTTLAEGSVKVSGNGESIFLKPAEQAQLTASGKLQVNTHPDLQEVLAWKDGLFRFSGSNIETIMRQVARWYNADVIYENKISGEFVAEIPRTVPVSELLKLLEATRHVRFKVQGNSITVTK